MTRWYSLFAATLAIRLAAIAYLIRVRPQSLIWGINEAGGIARWILLNHSFSTPFHDATGPTAWLGPVYPVLIAAIFKIFGIQTPASLLVAMILNTIFAGVTAVIIYDIAKDLWNERAAVIACLIWALCPYFILLVILPWETCLGALMFIVAFRCTLRMRNDVVSDWLWCGARLGNSRPHQSFAGDTVTFSSRISNAGWHSVAHSTGPLRHRDRDRFALASSRLPCFSSIRSDPKQRFG